MTNTAGTTTKSTDDGICCSQDCQATLGGGGCFGSKKRNVCTKCQGVICPTCFGKYALIPYAENKNYDDAQAKKDNLEVCSYCQSCFQEVSVLDYSQTFQDMKTPEEQANQITFVMVHGGGGSRAMFSTHAQRLISRGYRCILVDLPGHGTLVDTPLTLDSCATTVESVLKACSPLDPTKTIYVGASFGAYTGFYTLDKLASTKHFCGAILMDCGQNVGPDCSLKAGVGLWFLKRISRHMSNKKLLEAMCNLTMSGKKGSPQVDTQVAIQSVYGAGMFFQQGPAQCDCLHSVSPAQHIPNYGKFPILFFNGSEDYRDSEDKWLSLCQDQERSSLHVYQNGDHFFLHDSRFLSDLLDRMDRFAQQVAGKNS